MPIGIRKGVMAMLQPIKSPFNRIFLHRLDAASQYLHDTEETKEFTDSIQGNHLTKRQVATLKRRKLSFIGHLKNTVH